MSLPDLSPWKLPAATLVVLSFLALAFHYAFVTQGFRFNLTHSVPLGVYRELPDKPQRLDYVLYCLPISSHWTTIARDNGYLSDGDCPNGLTPVLKHLAGMPGDRIVAQNDTLALLVPHNTSEACLVHNIRVHSSDSLNRALPPSQALDNLDPNGVIPKGYAFLLGETGDSFDSRYYGVVPLKALRKAVPIMQF